MIGNELKQWRESLQVGDEVCTIHYGTYDRLTTVTAYDIIKLTKTEFTIQMKDSSEKRRVKRETGHVIGTGSYYSSGSSIYPYNEDAKAKQARGKAQKTLQYNLYQLGKARLSEMLTEDMDSLNRAMSPIVDQLKK